MSKVRSHLERNKKLYIGIGIGVGIAGITWVIMRKNPELQGGSGSGLQGGPEVRSFFLFSKVGGDQTTQAVTTIHTGKKGHSGFITKHLETGMLFESQKSAAEVFNVPETLLSGHLNGKFSDVDGHHFERVGVIA